tara:strand:+ start:484 stop:1491 length:1008 start_codon:yes stop_codon:yes gene_type:complete
MSERLRKLLFMQNQANQQNQNNLLSTNSALSGLLGDPTARLLIGANILGAGVKGSDPFSAITPAVLQTAQIQKALRPKRSKPFKVTDTTTGKEVLITNEQYANNPDRYAPPKPTQMFETAEQKEIGKVAGGEFKQISEAASAALGNNQNLDLMKEIVQLPNLKTGFAGEFRTSFAGLAKEFGIDTPIQDLTAAETLAGISGKLVLDGLSNFKGAISDGERQFLKEITPGLLNTKDGNLLLIEIGKKTNNLGIALSQEASKWVEQNGGLSKKDKSGRTWQEFKAAFHQQNPVLNNELKEQIIGLSKKIEPDFEGNIITAKDGQKYVSIGGKYYKLK